MKEYLQKLVSEQIEKAHTLKGKIKRPLIYPELSGLSNRCDSILDQKISSLEYLQSVIETEDDEGYAWRALKDIIRDIEWIEKYGIPALYYQSKEVGFFNKLIFQIHKEIRLPVDPPSVACLSTNYYYTATVVNVIFVPLSEADFILHLPDLYHELGHYVLGVSSKNKSLEHVRKRYEQAYSLVTDYYTRLLTDLRRGTPELKDLIYLIEITHSNWRYWLSEFFCDLFALYMLGPAYAWSNLHLCAKKSDNIYEFSEIQPQTHPSDESRMRILGMALRIIGFKDEAEKIEKTWNQVMASWEGPPVEYQYAFPDELLSQITELMLDSLKSCGFRIASPAAISSRSDKILCMLNSAWEKFWSSSPDEFRLWEAQELEKFRQEFGEKEQLV